MNLLMFCVLLLVALVCQPTLIYGLRGSHNSNAPAAAAVATTNTADQRTVKTFGGKVKRSRSHSLHASPIELASAKLVMSLESGDVLVKRTARGANVEGVDGSATPVDAATTVENTGKRNKNGNNNNNKKLNKSPDGSNGGRSKQEKKYSATIGSQAQQQQQQQQQLQHHGHNGSDNFNGNGNGNGNGKGRQRQQLRSQQQHQGHGKRGGNGGNGNGGGAKLRTESVEKTSTAEKSQSSCRYSKSVWTECDPKTNMRTRILTLKKGEANCLATRTMQKKCKKPCRYEKGTWSECVNGQMTRQDKLKSTAAVNPVGGIDATAESSCEPLRNINKKCNPGGAKIASKANKERKHKEKGQRRAQQQA